MDGKHLVNGESGMHVLHQELPRAITGLLLDPACNAASASKN